MGKVKRNKSKSKNCSEWKDAGFQENQMLQEMGHFGWEQHLSEIDLEARQTSKIEVFAKVVNALKSWPIFAKSAILDVRQDFKSTSDSLCT